MSEDSSNQSSSEQSQVPTFFSRFTDFFESDTVVANYGRQVNDALYSWVSPTRVGAPKTLIYSADLAQQVGFSKEFCESDYFAQVFSGNRLLPGMTPYATRYGGHQFGNWAGQLGDGRAINLGETVFGQNSHLAFQLKGAGPTPYSRGADGRAVLRSSLREFLCSEAMHYLGVPTTRALSLVLTGDSVVRDMFYDGNPEEEPGAIVCRVAPSFIRFGHFELCARKGENVLLKQLMDFSIASDFPHLNDSKAGLGEKNIYLRWFDDICRRTAEMIVHWMRVGFVHGVMNTDNMSILGLTIDYGPYGWLENYDPEWTPNTTDAQMRRYRFGQQAVVAQWNLYQLASAILPVTGDAAALEQTLNSFARYYEQRWLEMMAEKLGLEAVNSSSDEALVANLDRVMRLHEIDMTIFYRLLAEFDYQNAEVAIVDAIMEAFYAPETVSEDVLTQWNEWGRCYADRLNTAAIRPDVRTAKMNAVNPIYVLRNYLAQQAIDKAQLGDYTMLHELFVVLQQPYEENPQFAHYANKRPEWARTRAGCSALSCSS